MSEKTLSEVKSDDPTFRLDSEYFRSDYLDTIKLLKKRENNKLSSITSWVTQGPNPFFVDGEKIPCLTGRNISEGRVCYENADSVPEQEYEKFKRFQLKQGDTLVTLKGKGSIGKIGFVTSIQKSIFSRNIGIIRPKNIAPSYLNAYLLSRYGQKMILRGETGGTGQSTLTCSYLKNMDIPRLNIEEHIGAFVIKSEAVLTRSQMTYSEAEELLLEELELKDWKPVEEAVSVKSFSDFAASGRLDAEYYQPKYDEIEAKIKTYKNGYGIVADCFHIKDTNYTPDDDTCYKYIELSNIGNTGDISGCTNEKGSELPSRAQRIVNSLDIIVSSIEGSLQNCAIITTEYNRALCSTGFYVLEPDRLNPDTSLLLFKSAPIQQLMKKACSGTILTAMNKDEFLNIPIPIITSDIQTQIAEKIQESFVLKAESKRLLELAKTAVETAIEQGEEKALELLKQN